jgi:hypothetical protein
MVTKRSAEAVAAETALYIFDGIEQNIDEIDAIAAAGVALLELAPEDDRHLSGIALFRVIQEIAERGLLRTKLREALQRIN